MEPKLSVEQKAQTKIGLHHVSQVRKQNKPPPAAVLNHTQRMREQFDNLDTPEPSGYVPGPETLPDNLGWDDDIDGDWMLEESDVSDTDDPLTAPEEEDDEALPEDEDLPTIEDVVGSRRPAIGVELVIDGNGRLHAQVIHDSKGAVEALEAIRKLVENTFNSGKQKFDAAEWNELLGFGGASPRRRLFLLSRLVVDIKKRKSIAKGPGLSRYGKFVRLPDGAPFNIQLLLPDKRGRPRVRRTAKEEPGKQANSAPELSDADDSLPSGAPALSDAKDLGSYETGAPTLDKGTRSSPKPDKGFAAFEESGFDRLPDAIKLWIYRSVLDDEREVHLRDKKGKALEDADVFQEIVRRLETDGLLDDPPHPGKWAKTLRDFRRRLKNKGLEKLLCENGLEHLTFNSRERNSFFESQHTTEIPKEQEA